MPSPGKEREAAPRDEAWQDMLVPPTPQRGRMSRPGPMPLGNKAEQAEMQRLIREAQLDVAMAVAEASVKQTAAPQQRHPDAEREPLLAHPDGVNPGTGEVGGPKGMEPTRFGDWERKGRVFDF
jgi:hypothetical protein